MEEDDEIVLAGSGVKKLPDVRGSAFSKYASNEVALTMNVDSPEEMMGLSKLKEASQRKRMELNANLKAVNGAGVASGTGVGVLGNKSAGAVGVKNSKNNGKLPLKAKQDSRRAQ
ncbi:Myosin type-2 heavy chain 1 [Mucor velutinosus]|uniref:Myosin type-2 heavy chain 1 n=1 Tax=Mucor velutinosus TaxID=708070 RepID=A0AAN7D930_9FUNG|nr:Myosin type-2 heavy chain 1 [Mucor velutinosus]